MEKIPTAEEYAHTQYLKRREEVGPGQFYPEPPSTEQINDMIEFAKLHVEAALKAVEDKVIVRGYTGSLMNSYPLENIK